MLDLVMPWVPALAVVPIALSGMKKRRIAIPLIFCVYFCVLLIVAIAPHFLEMVRSGSGDPEWVAGVISKKIVSGVLGSLIDLPILFIVWYIFRRAKLNQL